MKPESAPLSYQGRVAQEKRRIESHMQAAAASLRSSWNLTRTTRRFAFDRDTEVIVWRNTNAGEHKLTISVSYADFTFRDGFTARVKLDETIYGVPYKTISVSRYPVEILEGLFVSLDSVEPFVQVGDGTMHLCLLFYCGASPEGKWPDGWIAGTKEEFNACGLVAK